MIKRKFQLSGATKAFRTRLKNKQMRGSLKGFANSLRPERGESIMEVIVSILIFSILMTTALAVVRTSLVITGDRLAAATSSQEEVNDLFLNKWSPEPGTDPPVITFTGRIILPDGTLGSVSIKSDHEIDLYDKNGKLVFRPVN